MFTTTHFACLVSLATSALAALGPVGTLHISNKDVSPDGSTRPGSVVNGLSPGPIIMAKKGDRIKMNVVNELTDPTQYRGTSIHWHGMFQRGTNYMDGVVGVNQCPIAPNNSFVYDFVADPPGTFWYHSHFGVQYCDGVRAPLIIQDPEDPLRKLYDVDDESTVIALTEWYHVTAASLRGTVPAADSTLINGKGRFPGGPKVDLAVVNVECGKRYRLRLVSMSCDPNFLFSIDNHDLTVIESDGASLVPHKVTTVRIFASQRYSLILHANQPADNYWIRSLPNSGQGNLNSTFEGGVNSAILRYKGAPEAEPTSTQQKDQNLLVEADLHALVDPFAPGEPTPDGADVTFNLTLAFDADAFRFSINGASYSPPTVPVLLQILSGARNAHDLLPQGSILTVKKGQVVQVNLPSGLIGGPHPFHLHGHAFSVIKSADSGRFNFIDPVQRDTVSAGGTEGDFVAFRFKADNPGPWILHCHIDFHLDIGLGIVFAEAPDQTPSVDRPPVSWENLCPNWDALPTPFKSPQINKNSTSASA